MNYPITEFQSEFLWGSYGPEGDKALQRRLLIDLESDHMINITRTQPHIFLPESKLFLDCICRTLLNRGYTIDRYINECAELHVTWDGSCKEMTDVAYVAYTAQAMGALIYTKRLEDAVAVSKKSKTIEHEN